MNDQINAGAEPASELSLRDTLAAEWEKQSAPETPAPVEAPAHQETEAEAAERIRDEKGRFAAKPAETAETAAKPATDPNAKAPVEKAAQEGDKPAEAPAKTVVGPPPGWSVAAKAEFDALPEAVRAAVAKREEEIDRGFAKLKDYKAIESQHAPTAQQYGVPLPEFINRLAAADKYLQREPENAIKWLAQTYGVDLAKFAGQPAQPGQQQPAPDAALQPLLQKISSLEQIIHGDKAAQVNNQVERFFSDPANKYSENVADQMVVLINEAKRAGQPVDLASIYETACFMNPEVRAALIKEQTGKLQSEQIEKARKTADQARAAGASITGGPAATPPPVAPNLDLRATLEQNFASLAGRT
ncbi:hypothetical protein [Mesorhizobium caraganae]|uniref:hypothetical protein n=1 Tax=Mesorhizobium caraganae TaxID=483206 RepID=UPI0017830A11|nr:hypothetical protein [Mesorhizobium caraganae]